jgi:lysosomal Pro-X carboxypeptidase
LLKDVNDVFKTCIPITKVSDFAFLEAAVDDAVVYLSQYNYPYEASSINPMPAYPVRYACEKMKQLKKVDLLRKLSSYTNSSLYNDNDSPKLNLQYLKVAVDTFLNYTGKLACFEIGNGAAPDHFIWEFQACTQMIFPLSKNGISDMFNPYPWNEEEYKTHCDIIWKGPFNPKWPFNYYGGRDFKADSKGFSNIFFINGKMDPWNSGCPQESGNEKVLIYLADAGHHMDIRLPDERDDNSIKEARNIMRQVLRKWISEYKLQLSR